MRLLCWWRGIWMKGKSPYGGHREVDIQRFSTTGQPFWQTICSVCGQDLGYWR